MCSPPPMKEECCSQHFYMQQVAPAREGAGRDGCSARIL